MPFFLIVKNTMTALKMTNIPAAGINILSILLFFGSLGSFLPEFLTVTKVSEIKPYLGKVDSLGEQMTRKNKLRVTGRK